MNSSSSIVTINFTNLSSIIIKKSDVIVFNEMDILQFLKYFGSCINSKITDVFLNTTNILNASNTTNITNFNVYEDVTTIESISNKENYSYNAKSSAYVVFLYIFFAFLFMFFARLMMCYCYFRTSKKRCCLKICCRNSNRILPLYKKRYSSG